MRVAWPWRLCVLVCALFSPRRPWLSRPTVWPSPASCGWASFPLTSRGLESTFATSYFLLLPLNWDYILGTLRLFVLVSVAVAFTSSFFFLLFKELHLKVYWLLSIVYVPYRLVRPLTCILSQFKQLASHVYVNILCVNLFKNTWKWTIWSKATMLSVSLTHNELLLLTLCTWPVIHFSGCVFQEIVWSLLQRQMRANWAASSQDHT